MATHTYHPPEEQYLILKDGCPRCSEHAKAPWYSLDADSVGRLVDIALAWVDPAGTTGRGPESATERIACEQVVAALDAAGALFGYPNRAAVVERLRG